MEIDIDDDREENKDIGFILVDSLKKDVLDTSLKMSSFLETSENFFKNAKRYILPRSCFTHYQHGS